MKNKIVTVFGGSGFLGRSVVQRLAQQGARVRVAVRNTDNANQLRVYGETGQIMPIQVCLSDTKAIESVCKGAHSVINLLGRLYEKRHSTFETVHIDAPKKIAKACAKNNVKHFVHVSAIGATPKANSKYSRTKGIGEQKALKAFPDTTIIRPSLIFGPDDRFFNRFASLMKVMPFLTLFEGGKTKFQPVYVGDVAQAIVNALSDATSKGNIYEFGGEKIYTFKELMLLMLSLTERTNPLISLPSFIGSIFARVLQFMPEPLITPDQLELLKMDAITNHKMKGLKDLKVSPKSLEVILPKYLFPYKPSF